MLIISPPESILPNRIIHPNSSYKLHEQLRSKCYFIPMINIRIEPDDDEYQCQSFLLNDNPIVTGLDNRKTVKTNEILVKDESSYLFTLKNDIKKNLMQFNNK